jgi:hypothetical protein
MSYFYRCRSCQETFPAFADDIARCAFCGSDQIEASPGAEPTRLERGAYYEIDLKIGKPKRHSGIA